MNSITLSWLDSTNKQTKCLTCLLSFTFSVISIQTKNHSLIDTNTSSCSRSSCWYGLPTSTSSSNRDLWWRASSDRATPAWALRRACRPRSTLTTWKSWCRRMKRSSETRARARTSLERHQANTTCPSQITIVTQERELYCQVKHFIERWWTDISKFTSHFYCYASQLTTRF